MNSRYSRKVPTFIADQSSGGMLLNIQLLVFKSEFEIVKQLASLYGSENNLEGFFNILARQAFEREIRRRLTDYEFRG